MSDSPTYDVVVVGGGPAGVTTALYTTRLGHRTALFEAGGGRHVAVESVHNLVGISEGVSGQRLAEHGRDQLEEYGADFYQEAVTGVEHHDGERGGRNGEGVDEAKDDDDCRFRVTATHASVETRRVVFATGFTDVEPNVPDLERFTGRGLHYCLHCDAYTLGDDSVFVLGHSDHAATVALILLNFTDDVHLLLDGDDPTWNEETAAQVRAHPIDRIETPVVEAFPEDSDAERSWLGGLTFDDGSEREYVGGFAVYGSKYNTDLAVALGCDLREDGAVSVDDDGETSVDGVFAVGDVTHGQNQTPIAMGDGARAGIALHKDLRRYPLPVEEIDDDIDPEDLPVPATADDIRAHMRRDRMRDVHAGLREP